MNSSLDWIKSFVLEKYEHTLRLSIMKKKLRFFFRSRKIRKVPIS